MGLFTAVFSTKPQVQGGPGLIGMNQILTMESNCTMVCCLERKGVNFEIQALPKIATSCQLSLPKKNQEVFDCGVFSCVLCAVVVCVLCSEIYFFGQSIETYLANAASRTITEWKEHFWCSGRSPLCLIRLYCVYQSCQLWL